MSEYIAKASIEPRDYRVVFLIQKTEEGAAKRTPFLPPQLGHISLLRKPGKLG